MRDESLGRTIGASIRRHREAKGLTQVALGERLGISEALMSRIESGQRGLDSTMLRTVAQVLEVPLLTLFGDQEGVSAAVPRDVVYARNGEGDPKATEPLVRWGRRILADFELAQQLG
jgi:transcriptional regulator with XRE-family HTH domain